MSDIIECYLQTWRDKLAGLNSKELLPADISLLFRQEALREAFFKIVDRDCNDCLNYEEWIGTFTKCIDPKDLYLLDWFDDQYEKCTGLSGETNISKKDFFEILSDDDFGYRFSLLISNKGKRVKTIQIMTTLEIIASMSKDGKWLSWLKYQFHNANKESLVNIQHGESSIGIENRITLEQFMASFEFKEPFLAHRLFNFLDKDNSGGICMREFINGLEKIVNGDSDEKMEFLFKVFDVNNDGRIDFDEMKMMLKCCMEDTPYVDMDQTMEELAAYLFTKTDKDDSGDISFEELQNAFKKYDTIFSQLSFSTSIWIKPKIIKSQHKSGKFVDNWIRYIKNKRPMVIFWLIYTLISIAVGANQIMIYMEDNIWYIIARFFGGLLNFNSSLIFVLMLRKHFTWLRTKGGQRYLPLDDFIELHKIIGWTILGMSIIHTIAHLLNLYIDVKEHNWNFWESLFTLSDSVGYPSGVIELGIFLFIFTFSMPFVRNKGYFEFFHWFHMLVIPWLLIMVIHAKNFWLWLIVPLFCYILENILRYRKISSNKFGETYIEESFVLPSKVTHLVIKKPPKFHFAPGDYIFVNIPSIAKYEWHPFSISSAPENSDHIWLHIRAVGNWTNKLLEYSMSSKFDGNSSANRSRQTLQPSCVMRTNAMIFSEAIQSSPTANQVKFNITYNERSEKKLSESDKKMIEANGDQKKEDISNKTLQKGILKKSSTEKSDGEVLNLNLTEIQLKGKPVEFDKSLAFNNSSFEAEAIMAPDLTEDPDSEIENRENNTGKKMTNKIRPMSSIDEMIDEKSYEKSNYFEKSSSPQTYDMTANRSLNSDLSEIIITDKNKLIKDQKDSYSNIPIVLFEQPTANTAAVNRVDHTSQVVSYQRSSTTALIKKRKSADNSSFTSDTLGYNQMYNKEAKVKIETIGLDNCWRLKIMIDGPYGTPSASIFDSEHAVLVGAGIGVTPFASILQSIMKRYKRKNARCPNCQIDLDKQLCMDERLSLKKVDFIWITREQRSLEWFISMLSHMEIEQRKIMVNQKNCDENMFMESHLYVTSAKRQSDLKSISLHLTLDAIYSQEENHMIDGLRKRTRYGRPNWDIVLQNLIRQQKGKIDVFYCGPPALGTILSGKCSQYNVAFCQEIF